MACAQISHTQFSYPEELSWDFWLPSAGKFLHPLGLVISLPNFPFTVFLHRASLTLYFSHCFFFLSLSFSSQFLFGSWAVWAAAMVLVVFIFIQPCVSLSLSSLLTLSPFSSLSPVLLSVSLFLSPCIIGHIIGFGPAVENLLQSNGPCFMDA